MTAKKEYRKPEIKKVGLRPEEAVLTACKDAIGCPNVNKLNVNCNTAAS